MSMKKHDIRSFMRSLPILAGILGRKLGVKIQIGGSPSTDGEVIYLPPLPLDGGEELFILANGFIDHEAAHVRDTDFDALAAARLSPLAHFLFNIVEDVRVERELAGVYPGCQEHFKKMYRQMLIGAEANDGSMAGRNITGWLMSVIFSEQYPDVEFPVDVFKKAVDDQFPSLIAQLEQYIQPGLDCASTMDCIKWGETVEGFLFRYFKRSKPQKKEEAPQSSKGDPTAESSGNKSDSSKPDEAQSGSRENDTDSPTSGKDESEGQHGNDGSEDGSDQTGQAGESSNVPDDESGEVTANDTPAAPAQPDAEEGGVPESGDSQTCEDAEDTSYLQPTGNDAPDAGEPSDLQGCENAPGSEEVQTGEQTPAPGDDGKESEADTPQSSPDVQGEDSGGGDVGRNADNAELGQGGGYADGQDEESAAMQQPWQDAETEQGTPETPDALGTQDQDTDEPGGEIDDDTAGLEQHNAHLDTGGGEQGDDALDEGDPEAGSNPGDSQDGADAEDGLGEESLSDSNRGDEGPIPESFDSGGDPDMAFSEDGTDPETDDFSARSVPGKDGSSSGTEPDGAVSCEEIDSETGGYGSGTAPGSADSTADSEPDNSEVQDGAADTPANLEQNNDAESSFDNSGIDMLDKIIQGELSDELSDEARDALGAMVNSEGEMPLTLADHLKQMLEMISREHSGGDFLEVAVVKGELPGEMPKLLIEEAQSATKVLATRLSGLLQTQTLTRSHTGRRGRIDGNRLHRLAVQNPRVFQRSAERQSIDTAVHILLDCSGSMSECMSLANAACYSVASALHRIRGVNVGVTAFPGTWDWEERNTVSPMLKHGQRMHTRFAAMAYGGTPMGEALWWTCQQMMALKEERKIILVITDGYPDSVQNTETALEAAKELGYEVIGIGIGQYGEFILSLIENSRVITDIQELAPAMFGVLQKALTDRG